MTNDKFSGVIKDYFWNWENQQLRVVYETLGEGSPLLLLPAFSSVSTRAEMGELARLLAPHFQVVAVDWPGFGESSRPSLDYNPALYQQFLADFIKSVFNTTITVLAAGHAAGYVMQLAQRQPTIFSKIVLVAPTWRGPLPTMGANQHVASILRGLVRSPIIGSILYQLNTTPSFLNFMYRRHVYADAANITPSFIDKKWQTTQKPGARFGSAAFVTGNLDTISRHSDFLELGRCLTTSHYPAGSAKQYGSALTIPLMVIIGESCPPKSRSEMDALAALPGVSSALIPGSLGLHEEYATLVSEAVLPFLTSSLS